MIKLKSLLNEKHDLETYHKSYTSAINAAKEYAEKKGYEINDDDSFTKIGMGPRKPS
jgi:ferredoxin-thioredoxin reductase catalytic subunit